MNVTPTLCQRGRALPAPMSSIDNAIAKTLSDTPYTSSGASGYGRIKVAANDFSLTGPKICGSSADCKTR
jgi:hypothetical protein